MASNSSTATARVSYRQLQLQNSSHGHASSLNSSSRNANGTVNSSNGPQQQAKHSARPKAPVTRRSVTPTSRSVSTNIDFDNDPRRVRVAVRLRPRNAQDILSDADFADCVELQPELKRLKLRKNNWSSESYRFDEVFTETASQKRIYEVVAKPVVECVLSGYNGTVMAYGQTGSGKTYTVGRLGKDDASERGIMVRAFEDIISSISPTSDTVEVSYLQLYMESIQDLLAPEKINLPIHEDPKTGEVSIAGAEVVKVRDCNHFLELLQIGEANRHAANTKLNTESSRSHAILMVYVRRHIHEKAQDQITSQEKDTKLNSPGGNDLHVLRKSKLLIVDLAGSERLDKSGSEGHAMEEAKFINLSLTSLGKCINALAENSPHIPIRDSKLTRLLRDSFGGSARTSLIVTIGPSARHHSETTSTIMFGQRAMKVLNMVKLKEEFDYESLCQKLEAQVDHLTAEIERQRKLRENDKQNMGKQLKECVDSFSEEKINLLTRSEFLENENAHLKLEMTNILNELNFLKAHSNLMHDKVAQLEVSLKHGQQHELENTAYQKVLADTTQMYEKKIAELIKEIKDERARSESVEQNLDVTKKLLGDHQKSIQQHEMENSTYQKALADTTQMYEQKIGELIKQVKDEHIRFEGAAEQLDLSNKLLSDCQISIQDQKEIEELRVKLQEMHQMHDDSLVELQSLKSVYDNVLQEKVTLSEELHAARQRLSVEEKQRRTIEHELMKLKKTVPEDDNDIEDKKSYMKENIGKGSSALRTPMGLYNSNTAREMLSGPRASIAKICEEVGLQKILQLLTSDDVDVQIHAVKVIANLAAEDINQEKIVEDGGLDALLMLLRSSQNATILRVASGAIANLAMNEINQGLIMSKGGAQLLARTASKTDDPQTLRMVAGALANLCGNEGLHNMLKEDGGIKALLGMVGSGNNEVIAQVARGVANFAKCESRGNIKGHRKGQSLLMDDSTLEWLIANSNISSASTRRHIELAICHLAQNEDDARDFISSGGLKELVRISVESNREDIRNLAKKTLKLGRAFQAVMKEE